MKGPGRDVGASAGTNTIPITRRSVSMSIYLHKHHIVPKHAGGTDDSSNLVELTIEDHAIAHKVLYGLYGRWQDRCAWEGLSNIVGREQIIAESIAKSKRFKDGKHTEEAKTKISAANKGKKLSKETRKKISDANKGKIYSEETKAKLSASNKGKKHSEETKRKLSKSLKGKTKSEEHKAKIAAANKGKNKGKIPWNKGKKCTLKS